MYSSVCISSGHGLYVRGASGILDEVDEARLVVEQVARGLDRRGVKVDVFHDNTSHSQNENLNTIVNHHNSIKRDLDISVHFNAYEQVEKPMGTEVLYVSQSALAAQMSGAIAAAGDFINRGGKKRTDLFFLNKTAMPAILIEVCFVDSEADASLYRAHFDAICDMIADVIGGAGEMIEQPEESASFHAIGKCSHFGGPEDLGVSDQEGLAFIYDVQDAPFLFLPEGTPGTEGKGLARKLNPHIHYVACRWDYARTPKPTLLQHTALVKSLKNGVFLEAFPADWGPHQDTGRIADLSPGLMADLGIETDDEVEIIYPHEDAAV